MKHEPLAHRSSRSPLDFVINRVSLHSNFYAIKVRTYYGRQDVRIFSSNKKKQKNKLIHPIGCGHTANESNKI